MTQPEQDIMPAERNHSRLGTRPAALPSPDSAGKEKPLGCDRPRVWSGSDSSSLLRDAVLGQHLNRSPRLVQSVDVRGGGG
jgi:hypothetical protein